MKTLIAVLLFSFVNLAYADNKPAVWTEDYSGEEFEVPLINPMSDEDFRWLYDLLFPESIRSQLPAETFKSFRVHLKDTYKVFPHPNLLSQKNMSRPVQRVEGKITYAGFFPKKYQYDVAFSPIIEHSVRIYLIDATPQDMIDFKEKLEVAEDQWNQDRVEMDFEYAFSFAITTNPEEAHYSVKILDSTRGPYDRNWGRNWTAVTIAHELGHMLGLGDEYDTISGKTDCLTSSLMCGSWSGNLMYHNYYFILRRLVQIDEKPQP